jgi:UDP-2,4-diacetamido-2,4,6-trideoxy-beta-L-altropyranose hydrolase
MKPLFIRTDAHASTGIGHFMRCFALAQAWKDQGGQVVFVTSCKIDSLFEKLKTEGFVLQQLDSSYPDEKDLDLTLQLLNSAGSDSWLVLDGYHFDSCYQERIKEQGYRLLAIDDTAHLPMYWADLILNQNLGSEEVVYHYQPYTKLLLGSRYILLRREFTSWEKQERIIPTTARKILIAMGGGDEKNLSSQVIQALQKATILGLECRVLVGAANPHISALEKVAKGLKFPVQLLIDPPNVPEIMCWANLAIAAAGSVCWELAYLGVPMIPLILSRNQFVVAQQLAGAMVANSVDVTNDLLPEFFMDDISAIATNPSLRALKMQAGQELVDGEGCSRVVAAIKGDQIRLRLALESDAELIWKWANDPETRSASFSTESISWDGHLQWFSNRLGNPYSLILLGMDEEDCPFGYVRFEITEHSSIMSINLNPDFRRLGFGWKLIQTACELLFSRYSVQEIHAFIKKENIASSKSFQKSGFHKTGAQVVKGSMADHYILTRGT